MDAPAPRTGRSGRSARPRRSPTTRASPARAAGGAPTRSWGGAPGGAPELDPRQACCMVALAAVEVLAGSRPLAQLARWLTPEVYDGLARRAALTAPRSRVLDAAAGLRDVAAEPTDTVPAGAARRPSVRRVRVHRVDAHTVEASVVVAQADRVRAVAVRLTRSTGRWRAAALVVG
ncbi:Rv3235 family protein [Cellulomonas sp. PS-H5]|uniref:Rv3235 family protein n=1 Tax=Cellulomonas sp. PS-H5 TaxID=2820400 RepID=UPI0027E2AA54|nr:Rv3235 family protein [Cellulomonas sp. PS-H5]